MSNKTIHSLFLLITFYTCTAFAQNFSEEEKIAGLLNYTNELSTNQKNINNIYITQESIGKIARFLNYYHYSYANIFNAKMELNKNTNAQSENFFKTEDTKKILRDFLDIRARMDELEQYHGFRCIFAFGELMDKAIEKSAFKSNDKHLYSLEAVELTQTVSEYDNRYVIGLCWEKDLFPTKLIE